MARQSSSSPPPYFYSHPSTMISGNFPADLPPSPPNGNRTPGINPLTNTSTNTRTSLPGKHCWVCFATDEDDYSALWVSPCRCRGTAKWVHQECLQRWVDEKQQGSSGGKTSLSSISNRIDLLLVKVACPQCNTEYLIVYPRQGQSNDET